MNARELSNSVQIYPFLLAHHSATSSFKAFSAFPAQSASGAMQKSTVDYQFIPN